MNEDLHKKLSQLESLISTQKEFVIEGKPESDYMHGMLNGMILSHSLFDNSSPNFYTKPRRRPSITRIRHKSNK